MAFSNIELPREGLSLLDPCAVDDGFQREAPIHSLSALVFQLCTSQKATGAILEILNNGEAFWIVSCHHSTSDSRRKGNTESSVLLSILITSQLSLSTTGMNLGSLRKTASGTSATLISDFLDDPELPKCVGEICGEIHKVHKEIMAAVDRGIEAGNPLDQLVG